MRTIAPATTATGAAYSEGDATGRACGEMARKILKMMAEGAGGNNGGCAEPDARRVRRIILDTCSRYSLPRVPGNREILLAAAGGGGDRFRELCAVLRKKPAKTASGVAVVAVMPKPFACPHGRCTYCPGGPEYNTPNSYTGAEPSTIDAIRHEYDPVPQIRAKLEQLEAFGHDTSKTELVIVGGTFLFMPPAYRRDFVRACYDALNGVDNPSKTLLQAQRLNERAAVRSVGFAIETKPDYCKAAHIDAMLDYGVTRVEIGVQSLRDRVYKIINRGHTYADVTESFQLAKDAGYKIAAHMMPGLPTMTPEDDMADFARLYDDPDLRPDMLKIYPALVIKGTPLYEEYASGRYSPYSDHEMINVLADAKRRVPKWVRIMRVQREIPPSRIVAGPRHGNLRQMVRDRLAAEGTPCRCIRCREAGLQPAAQARQRQAHGTDGLHIDIVQYDSSGGREAFISYEDDDERIYGFVRLRKPSSGAHRPELAGVTESGGRGGDGVRRCIVRELHVYGRAVGIGVSSIGNGRGDGGSIQHAGIGRSLMGRAEDVARDTFGAEQLLVISAVGAREYYSRLGYSLYGPYMCKELMA